MIRVKICCIASIDESKRALEVGASAIGLVSEMPSGPGVISEGAIRRIASELPPGISSFLLTSKTQVEDIVAQQQRCRVNTLQLVESLPPSKVRCLRETLPGIKIVKVIHIEDESSLEHALSYVDSVDALLLDSGSTRTEIKELGGTGCTHDWSISRRIVVQSSKPVFLAGGLNAENVKEAIQIVRPFGVDVCSGVRTNSGLDIDKLCSFTEAVASTT
jgi:phosphoribosylanthranilate isomerase